MFGCISFLHFGKLHYWLFTPLAKMLKISVTEVYCSAMFIIQLNMHSPLHFLLNLAGTNAHIRQVGRTALLVTVSTYLPGHSRVGVGSGRYCADLGRPRPRAAMASTLPDSTSQLTSHLRQVSWGMIEQNCFEWKQILSDCKRSRKVNFFDRHLEYLSLWYG